MGNPPKPPVHLSPLWPFFVLLLLYILGRSVVDLLGARGEFEVRDVSIAQIRPSMWHERGRVRIADAEVLSSIPVTVDGIGETYRFIPVAAKGAQGGNFLLMKTSPPDDLDDSKVLVGRLSGGMSLGPEVHSVTFKMDPKYSWKFAGVFEPQTAALQGKALWGFERSVLLTVMSAAALAMTVARVRQKQFRPIA